MQSSDKLGKSWKTLKKNFKLLEVIGSGSYGTVVRAIHRETNKSVAVKYIKCSFNDLDHMKYVLREITI